MLNEVAARRATTLATGLVCFFLSKVAFPHHPMGEMTPETLWQGLLSGIGHPVIGLDHLAFVVALGLLAAWQAKSGIWLLLGFLPATILGALLTEGGLALPFVELGIALSVVVIGAALFAGWTDRLEPLVLLAAVSGLFHGLAYGEAIVGAESTPIIAYLVGFLIIQSAIALVVMCLVRWVRRGRQGDWLFFGSRSVGVAVGVTGAVFAVSAMG